MSIPDYLKEWSYSAAVAGTAVLLGLALYFIFTHVLSRVARRTATNADNSLLKHTRGPLRALFPLLFLYLVIPLFEFPAPAMKPINDVLGVLLIASIAWLGVKLTAVMEEVILERYDLRHADNLKARRIYTQVRILNRIITVAIIVVALSAVLMSFDKFRALGTGLLASAGIMGLVVGLAARSTVGNLLAGIQIALTQPIRLDDVIIVENEWGWVEEITLTYVVVRVWDLRRLILPISYFIEKPFQNWTRNSSALLGTVYLYLDYNVPVEKIRTELLRILEVSGLWDKKAWGLQVTGATERALELRALMSAPDSGAAWDLRCHVREKLVDFVRREYPGSLPRTRATLEENRQDRAHSKQDNVKLV